MKSKNILLAGLPAAGKSTYVAVLWAVEKDGQSGHLWSCDGLPFESSYIDGMRENWLLLKEVRRTTFAEPQEIALPMKGKRTGEKISLALPDFKGEIFQRVLDNSVSEEVETWCENANGILFMLNLGSSSPDPLQEHMSGDAQPKVNLENVVMTSNDITAAIKNVLLMKYLWEQMGDCPISICFSRWDLADLGTASSVDQWVRENHPSIYNFVEEHFSDHRYFGISSQGADYKGLDETQQDALAELTTTKERAYIYTDKKSFDITEPIDYIIVSSHED